MKGRLSKLDFLCDKISTIFHNFSGHQLSCIASFDGFTSFMYKKVDAASIGIGRMLFGEFYSFENAREREFKECYCHLRCLAFYRPKKEKDHKLRYPFLIFIQA